MPLSIKNNALSLGTPHRYAEHVNETQRLLARLTSGTRIAGATDDPAGQALSARMSSGLKGMSQAMRNINDATSMLQVADSALSNIGDNLQRLRELTVASGNGALTDEDRNTLQAEADAILTQVSQVGKDTMFNGEAIFALDTSSMGEDKAKRAVLDSLRAGWLSSAEDLVSQYYGLQGDGATISVNFDTTDGVSGVLASVTGSAMPGSDIRLNIDMADFADIDNENGGAGPVYNDRVVAHEMVHAIMLHATSFSFPQWFIEGTAELIQGADERVAGVIAGGKTAADIVSEIAGGGFSYEGGYVASRYLHAKLKDLGVDGGIKGLMTYLTQNRAANLDVALNAVSGGVYATDGAFLRDFGAQGTDFITQQINLVNADTGAIGGLHADGGPSRNAADVVPDAGLGTTAKPLRNFALKMPNIDTGGAGTRRVQVQAGSRTDDLIEMEFAAVDLTALGLTGLDLRNTAVSLLHIDEAIDYVGKQRVAVGAYSNRMDVVAGNVQTSSVNLETARERIQGVDYATSTAKLTRSQILQQAASAIMTQANGEPRAVLALLR